MPWYSWLVIGMFLGFCISVGGVVGFSFTVMRKPALMQRFSRRMMRAMMNSASPKKKEASKRANVGQLLLAILASAD